MVVAETELDRMCPVIPQEAQIGFDAVALAFLIFQLRVFHSWFFQHCMVEYRSEIILANRLVFWSFFRSFLCYVKATCIFFLY